MSLFSPQGKARLKNIRTDSNISQIITEKENEIFLLPQIKKQKLILTREFTCKDKVAEQDQKEAEIY
jgi:hypothetical protein